MNKFIFACLIIFATLLVASCQKNSSYKKIIGSTMGTHYSIIAKVGDQDFSLIHQQIEQELKDINMLMSTYIPDSEINQFNTLADDSCFKFSDKTWSVLSAARKIYNETDGAFDITLGPLISRWGFNVEEYDEKLPNEPEIKQLLSISGTDKLSFNVAEKCISKTNTMMTINLSAIAKGYGVDRLALILDNNKITDYLVEIGGEVKAKGLNNSNKNWKIAVEDPSKTIARKGSIIVNLINSSIATSGDYRNYFIHQGKRFSHTIDPTTGYPISHHMTSISVIHSSNMYADAYATALNVMGSEKAEKFAESNKLAIYYIVNQDGETASNMNYWFTQYTSNQ